MTPRELYREGNNGPWEEWRRLVLSEMKRNTDAIEKLQGDMDVVKERSLLTQQELKIRSGVWGMVGGVVTMLSVLLLTFFRRIF